VFIYACEVPANGDAVRLVRLAAIANAIVQPVVQLALCTPLLAYSSGDDFFLLRLELRRDVPPISAEEAAAAAAAALRRDALDVVDTPLSQSCIFESSSGAPTACVQAAAHIQLGRVFDASRGRLSRSNSVRGGPITVVGPVSCITHRFVGDDGSEAEAQFASAPQLLLYKRFEHHDGDEHAVHSVQFIVDAQLPRQFDDDSQSKAGDERGVASPLTGLLSPDRIASPRSPVSVTSESDASDLSSSVANASSGVGDVRLVAGVRLLVSTAYEGSVYDTASLTLLSTYTYPNPTVSVVAGRYFLFAVTPTSLESWMLRRVGLRANGTPIVPPEPLLVSMQKFVGLRAAVPLETQVVLRLSAPANEGAVATKGKSRTRSLSAVSNSPAANSDELSWALSVLQLASCETIAETQLYEAAQRFEGVDAVLQQRLLDEACALLRERLATVVGRSGTLSLSDHVIATDLRARLRVARRRLAEKKTAVGAFAAAAPLWAASDAAVEVAFTALEGKWHGGDEERAPLPAARAKPLTRYLNKVLFDGVFLRDRLFVVDGEGGRHTALANSILLHYSRYESESLPLVLLESWLTGNDAAYALELMRVANARAANVRPVADARSVSQSMSKRSPALLAHMRRFANAVLAAEVGDVKEAETLIDAIPPWALVELFASNSKLFQRDMQRQRGDSALAPGGETLGELMLRLKPWCLVDIARQLLRASGAIDASLVTSLADTFYDLLGRRPASAPTLIQQACVLESLLLAHPGESESAVRLARCYLTLLGMLNKLPSTGLLETMQKRTAVDDNALGAFLMREFSTTAVSDALPRWLTLWDASTTSIWPRKFGTLISGRRFIADLCSEAREQAAPTWLQLLTDVERNRAGALRRAVGCLPRDALFAFASENCKQLRDWAVLVEAMSERSDNLEAIHQLLAALGSKLTAAQYLAILPESGSAALFLQHAPPRQE
jgi:hypothetical protein